MGNGVFKKISGQDRTITPFKVYKSWRYTSTSSLADDGIDRLAAIKPDQYKYTGNKVTLDTWQTQLDSSSLFINSANDKEASLIWYSLNHLYYKRAGKPAETFGYSDPYAIERTLFDDACVISVPQKKFGESIKPGSVKLRLQNTQLNNASMSLADDGKGNLIDTELSSSISGELLYLGFNSMTYAPNYVNDTITTQNTYEDFNYVVADTNVPEVEVISKNVWITPKYNLPYGSGVDYGNAARMYDDGYIRIPNRDEWNFKLSQDYAVSFWCYHEGSRSGTVLSKRTTGKGDYLSNGLVVTGDVNCNASQYPFDITVSGSLMYAKISNGSNTVTLTANAGPNTKKHYLLQKTGSQFEIYVNGTLAASSSIFTDGNIYNNADIFIGSLGIDSATGAGNAGLRGAVDEFFIFNKGLTQAEITQICSHEMSTNTNVVGNVFYEHGLIVISDPRSKYGTSTYRTFNDVMYNYITNQNLPSYFDEDNFYLEFNSTVTLYEHEYVIKLKEDEFNFTSNATIRKDNDENSPIPKDIVFNANFAPYITTVGLYTENGELVAVGKLGTPIKKRDDVDLNIIVRFDI